MARRGGRAAQAPRNPSGKARKRLNWTEEAEDKVILMRHQGRTWREIASALNIPRWQSVQMHYLRNLKEPDAKNNETPLTEKAVKAIEEDWGTRWERVSEKTGIPVQELKRLLRASSSSFQSTYFGVPCECGGVPLNDPHYSTLPTSTVNDPMPCIDHRLENIPTVSNASSPFYSYVILPPQDYVPRASQASPNSWDIIPEPFDDSTGSAAVAAASAASWGDAIGIQTPTSAQARRKSMMQDIDCYLRGNY